MVLEEVNHLLYNSWKAFSSHSISKMNEEIAGANI
jgi:hypothetical protein